MTTNSFVQFTADTGAARFRHAQYTLEELATASAMVVKLKRGEDGRADRVAEMRAMLAQGQCDRSRKLGIAVDRLLDELAA